MTGRVGSVPMLDPAVGGAGPSAGFATTGLGPCGHMVSCPVKEEIPAGIQQRGPEAIESRSYKLRFDSSLLNIWQKRLSYFQGWCRCNRNVAHRGQVPSPPPSNRRARKRFTKYYICSTAQYLSPLICPISLSRAPV